LTGADRPQFGPGDVPAHVADVSARRIRVAGRVGDAPPCRCTGAPHATTGLALGFDSDDEVIAALNCLIRRGFLLMEWGHSWPPAAVAAHFREKGAMIEPFQVVTFDGTWYRVG
jgi:hypothetical protein